MCVCWIIFAAISSLGTLGPAAVRWVRCRPRRASATSRGVPGEAWHRRVGHGAAAAMQSVPLLPSREACHTCTRERRAAATGRREAPPPTLSSVRSVRSLGTHKLPYQIIIIARHAAGSHRRARHAAGSHRRAAATGLGVPPWLGAAAAAGTPDPAVATPASTSGGGATPRQAAAARLTRHLSSGSGGARQRHHASPCVGATPEPTTVPRLASQGDKASFGGSCKHCPVAQRVAQVQHCGSGTPC